MVAKKRAVGRRPPAKKAAARSQTWKPPPGVAPDSPEAIRARRVEEQRAEMLRIGVGNEPEQIPQNVLEHWTDEELHWGAQRKADGSWPNRPVVVPRSVYKELWRRSSLTIQEDMREGLLRSIKVLVQIANNPNSKDADRIKAITVLMDRVLGKVPEHVIWTENDPSMDKPRWATALDVAIVSDSEE